MAITPFSDDVQVIHKLGDRPIVDNNLTVQQFKDKFDEAAVAIKNYINNTLLPALEGTDGASNTGIEAISGLDAETVQEALEALAAEAITLPCSVSGNTVTVSDLTPFEDATALAQSDAIIVLETDIGKYKLPLVKKTGSSLAASLLFVGPSINYGYGYLIVASFSVPYGSTATSITGNYYEIRIAQPSDYTPQMDGIGYAGTSVDFSRADHVHPSDTSKYEKPVGGIPASDLDSDVQASLGKADTAYQRPFTGIPASALAIAVRISLNKADSAYQKPANGIPSSDIDPEALPKPAAYAPQMDGVAAKGISSLYAREDHVHPSDTSKITMPDGGSAGQVLKKTANGTEWANESGGGGTTEIFDAIYGATTVSEIETALSNGKLLRCTYDGQQYYLGFTATSLIRSYIFFKSNGSEVTVCSIDADTGVWSHGYRIIPSAYNSNPAMDGTASTGSSTFFARGDHVHPSDTTKADKVTVTTVSDDGAVSQALDAGKIYDFTGALTSLTITLNAATAPAQYHFRFDSGSTAVSLTLPQTVTMPSGFQVEASKHYEIDIMDGYGAAQSW